MPLYAYRCPTCGHKWDEFRSIEGSETSEERCERCAQTEGLVPQHGTKVPGLGSVSVPGGTPIHFPGKKENK